MVQLWYNWHCHEGLAPLKGHVLTLCWEHGNNFMLTKDRDGATEADFVTSHASRIGLFSLR